MFPGDVPGQLVVDLKRFWERMRVAAPLEKIGVVARQTDERDARLAFVVLTESGLEKVHEARVTFTKQAGYIFRDRWTEEDLEQLSGLLHRLIADAPGNLT